MTNSSPLLLKTPALLKRVETLFAELKENTALQSAFMHSPEKVIGESALPSAGSGLQASKVSQFVFSVLQSEKWRRWQEQHRGELQRPDRTAEEDWQMLTGALVECGGLQLSADAGRSSGTQGLALHSASKTFIKTLDSRTTAFLKINPRPARDAIRSLQVMNLAEQLLQLATSKPLPTITTHTP